jgi:hypothetical protein
MLESDCGMVGLINAPTEQCIPAQGATLGMGDGEQCVLKERRIFWDVWHAPAPRASMQRPFRTREWWGPRSQSAALGWYAAPRWGEEMVGDSVPGRCLVCGAPLGRRDGLTPGKDSLLSDLATCAKMIATLSGEMVHSFSRLKIAKYSPIC